MHPVKNTEIITVMILDAKSFRLHYLHYKHLLPPPFWVYLQTVACLHAFLGILQISVSA